MKNRSGFAVKDNFTHILGIFAAITFFALMVGIYSYNHTPAQNVGFFRTPDGMTPITEGWTLTDGDSVYSVSLPSKNKLNIENNTVILDNTLPDKLEKDSVILFRTSLQSLDVYLDGVRIYTYGGKEYRAFGKNMGSIWNIIPLSENDAGKSIKLVVTSPYETYKNIFNTFYVGSYESALSKLFSEYGINFLIVFVTFIIGLALFVFFIVFRAMDLNMSTRVLLVSLIAIVVSVWEFSECKLTQMLIGNMAGFSAINFLSLSLVGLPTVMYADIVEGKNYHRILCPIEVALEMNAVAQIILQLSGVADFYEMMIVTHIILAIGSLTMVFTLIRKYRKHKEPGLFVLLLSVVLLAFAGISEIILTYATGYVGGLALLIAVLVVIVCTGLESVRVVWQGMRDAKAAVEESAAKSTFLANMSHEIRTPMNSICAFSELLMNAEDLSVGNRDFAKTIHSSAENLLEIINDLLDFSKITAKKYDITCENYELSELVENVKDIISERAYSKGLGFNIHINPRIPCKLYGDMGRIRQILLNLLNNAVKFTDAGSVSLDIDCEPCDEKSTKLIFKVSDTGVGIKSEDMESLFEAFVQVDKAKTKANEGTGLGLAISKALAVMMGGTIFVESEYNRGSTFVATVIQEIQSTETIEDRFSSFFTKHEEADVLFVEGGLEANDDIKMLLNECSIPYVCCSEEELENEVFKRKHPLVVFATREHETLLSGSFAEKHRKTRVFGISESLESVDAYGACEILRKPVSCCDLLSLMKEKTKEQTAISFRAPSARIMIVDDNIINLRVMKELLLGFGIRPTLCSNGIQAVAAMKVKNFDLIFMDHMMPGMDGMEATRQIRAIPTDGERVKIVALTANVMQGIDKVFLDNGFDAFLAKPVSISEVGKVLQKHLPKDKIYEL